MSENVISEIKSNSKSKGSRSHSSRSHCSKSCSKSYSSRSCSSCSRSSCTSCMYEPENKEERNIVTGFISSLFEEEKGPKENANPKKNTITRFNTSVANKESNKKGSKVVKTLVDPSFTEKKPKKKFLKNITKTEKPKEIKKGERKIDTNMNAFPTQNVTLKDKNKINFNKNEKKIPIFASKKNFKKNSLTTNNSKNKRLKTAENRIDIYPKFNSIKNLKSNKNNKNNRPIITIVKKSKKKDSIEIKSTDKNDKINHSINLNWTMSYPNVVMSEQYRAKLESDKEMKEYEERIKLMKNHISAMRRHEDEMIKKINFLKHKEANINSVKKEKEIERKAIIEYNNNKKAELEQKKKHIEQLREIINKGIKESSEKTKMDKINKYKQSQREREEVNNKLNDFIQNKNNDVKNKIEKIKALREYNKNLALNRKKKLNQNYNELYEKKYERNIERTNLLKMEIKQLQSEENVLLSKLNKTRKRLDSFNSTENIYFGNKRKSRKSNDKISVKPTIDNE